MKKKSPLFLITAAMLLVSCGTSNKPSSNNSQQNSNPSVGEVSNSEANSSVSSENSSVISSASSASSKAPESSSQKQESSTVQSSKSSAQSSVSSSKEKEKFTITVTNGTGSGTYEINSSVVVDCEVPEGYEFECWKEGDVVVSKVKQYRFFATRNITLTAHFTKITQTFEDIKGLKTLLASISDSIKEKTSFASEKIMDKKYSNEYRAFAYENKTNYYKTGKKLESKETDVTLEKYQNSITKTEVSAIKDGKYYNVYSYDVDSPSYPSSATKKNVVNEVKDENKDILNEIANKELTNNIVEDLINAIDAHFLGNIDQFAHVQDASLGMVGATTHRFENNFYIKNRIAIELDAEAGTITKAIISEQQYVRATALDEDGKLIPGAETAKELTKEFNFTYDEKQDLPSDIVLDSYFISSFEVEADYYDGSAYRVFNKDFLFLPMEATIRSSEFEIVKSSVQPATALEEKKIGQIVSSNEEIVKVERNDIKTLKAGKVNLTFITTQGASCTYEVEVKALAPKEITIICEDTVEINERIEITAEVNPITSSTDIEYTVNDSTIASITEEDGHVYLNGLAEGNVTVRATSKLDKTKYGEKLVVVTPGAQSADGVQRLLVGTWRCKYEYAGGPDKLIATFNADGTFTLEDVFRGENVKLSGTGNYEIVEEIDAQQPHVGTYYEDRQDVYVLKISNYTLTGSNAGKYFVALHFLIKTDGSKLYMHSQNANAQGDVASGKTSEFIFDKD